MSALRLAFAALVFALFATCSAAAEQRRETVVALADLPREAQETVRLIHRGGPYRYQRDGVEFGNFERLLPPRGRGYYREYTVPTPGVSHRGARRVVSGRGGELYYTDDHYRSFRRIRE